MPEMPGMSTSDIRRSGDFALAAANASSGEVKNFAENPCICRMTARVDAMTGSSSTTKTCGPELEGTYYLFRLLFP
jgi:hypothetical protein